MPARRGSPRQCIQAILMDSSMGENQFLWNLRIYLVKHEIRPWHLELLISCGCMEIFRDFLSANVLVEVNKVGKFFICVSVTTFLS